MGSYLVFVVCKDKLFNGLHLPLQTRDGSSKTDKCILHSTFYILHFTFYILYSVDAGGVSVLWCRGVVLWWRGVAVPRWTMCYNSRCKLAMGYKMFYVSLS